MYDLEERTARFGEQIIFLARRLEKNSINKRLVDQVVGAGISIGLNYREANAAESLRDFRHKIAICRKESNEVKHALHMIEVANSHMVEVCRSLWKEANELLLIFSASIRTCDKKLRTNEKKSITL